MELVQNWFICYSVIFAGVTSKIYSWFIGVKTNGCSNVLVRKQYLLIPFRDCM